MSTTMPEPQPYAYEPLASIDAMRILCLEPADDELQPLRGYLLHITRYEELEKPSPQKYVALSYVWGEPIFNQRLLLWSRNSKRYDMFLPITENVNIMLQHLRSRFKTRFLWLDAVCLNQKNDAEKSHQIPMMGEIYRHAPKVIFWLGADRKDETAKVFTYFRLLAAFPDEDVASSNMVNRHPGGDPLMSFFQRDWFYRRWIIQEAALAQNGVLCCGHYSLPYLTLVTACQRLQASGIVNEYAVQMILTCFESKKDIYALLWKLHKSQCSDPRDRIAALYGLIPRNRQLTLDYETSFHAIYQEHAIALVNSPRQHHFILHLFQFSPLRTTESSAIPSWIPNWSQERTAIFPYFFDHRYDRDINPPQHGDQQYQFRQGTIGDTTLRGIPIQQPWFSGLTIPTTVFSARVDIQNKAILNMAWVNPWGGSYGRRITAVMRVEAKDLPLLDNGMERNQLRLFPQLGYSVGEQRWSVFSRLCRLIRWFMNDYSKRRYGIDLVKRPSYRFDTILNAMCRYYQVYNSGEFLKPKPSPREEGLEPQAMVAELARMLYDSKMAIIELQGLLDFSYAIGADTLERGMRVIPLASHIGGTETSVAWWQDVGSGRDAPGLSNMIVVKLHSEPAWYLEEVSGRANTHTHKKERKTGSSPPIRATYVGQCLAAVPSWREARPPVNKGLEAAIRHAGDRGLEPPFTIDLV
ncbi:heterokaryon incompatibility protein-domain-containing protein [Clohesyomyces aquaticus]|uniref:Heterokaryon incompatibility protein-domain-containing protein n=1 Tax=Clohesyomyces aquaticus TaxID=1231657 RepID=A0A1Y1ZP19_9PLEO|nr:heterokaryon incompatibility protein-domain-containing protein [Clohesyomyces aquaticus]